MKYKTKIHHYDMHNAKNVEDKEITFHKTQNCRYTLEFKTYNGALGFDHKQNLTQNSELTIGQFDNISDDFDCLNISTWAEFRYKNNSIHINFNKKTARGNKKGIEFVLRNSSIVDYDPEDV